MIVGVSNVNFANKNYIKQEKNILTNKELSPLEKQKQQLQEQIKKIQESDSSEESKVQAIKQIEDELKEIEQKLMQEKCTQSNEKKQNEKVKEMQKAKEEEKNDGNSQLMNSEVTMGIVSAFSHMKAGKAAYSIHKIAELKGDTVVSQRALGYEVSEIKKSSESAKLIQNGISAYKKQMDIAEEDKDSKSVIDENGIGNKADNKLENASNTESENSTKETSKFITRVDVKA